MTDCHRCNGSGEIAISAMNGAYLFPGPVPDDAKGIVGATCYECRDECFFCGQCEDAGWVLSSCQAAGAPNFMECPECGNPMERRSP